MCEIHVSRLTWFKVYTRIDKVASHNKDSLGLVLREPSGNQSLAARRPGGYCFERKKAIMSAFPAIFGKHESMVKYFSIHNYFDNVRSPPRWPNRLKIGWEANRIGRFAPSNAQHGWTESITLPRSMTVLPVGPSASIVSTSLVATGTVFGAGKVGPQARRNRAIKGLTPSLYSASSLPG